ncbi:hypothetical protein COO60DRAFT_1530014 [Scenedesmus sp. NREL 46B-D3]|nr:hypothetical protein COO60DRAFT_1530014 [Scenedesmus sp. NREL 46B-D3]
MLNCLCWAANTWPVLACQPLIAETAICYSSVQLAIASQGFNQQRVGPLGTTSRSCCSCACTAAIDPRNYWQLGAPISTDYREASCCHCTYVYLKGFCTVMCLLLRRCGAPLQAVA